MKNSNYHFSDILVLPLVFWLIFGYFVAGPEKFIYSLYALGFLGALFISTKNGVAFVTLLFSFLGVLILSSLPIYLICVIIGASLNYISYSLNLQEIEKLKKHEKFLEEKNKSERIFDEAKKLENEKLQYLYEIERIKCETLIIKKRLGEYPKDLKYFPENPFEGINIYHSKFQEPIVDSPYDNKNDQNQDSNLELKQQIRQIKIEFAEVSNTYNREILKLKALHQQYLNYQMDIKGRELEKIRNEHFLKKQQERDYFRDIYK